MVIKYKYIVTAVHLINIRILVNISSTKTCYLTLCRYSI